VIQGNVGEMSGKSKAVSRSFGNPNVGISLKGANRDFGNELVVLFLVDNWINRCVKYCHKQNEYIIKKSFNAINYFN